MSFLLTKKLKYFMTVMEKRCLTKASEELFITRSPLGKAINELETILGNKLFIRQHGQLEPTEFALNLHSQIESLYKKILELEKRIFSHSSDKNITIIFDSNYPSNLSEIITCSLKNSGLNYHISKLSLHQDMLEQWDFDKNTLLISNTLFGHSNMVKAEHSLSSGLVLLMSKEISEDKERLSSTPLLLRENTYAYAPYFIKERLEPFLGAPVKIKCIEGSIVDFLIMTGNGEGLMMLPQNVCDLLKVNRSDALFLNDWRIKTYYYSHTRKSSAEINKIIKHISKLL